LSNRVRVKICGITRLEDAHAAIAAGADALGFVFYSPSPRFITPEAAAALIQQLPPFVTIVGLVVNPTVEYVNQLLHNVPLDLLQFHGEESPDFCQQFQFPWIKALSVKPHENVLEKINAYSQARAILLDTWHPDLKGGTGQSFEWSAVPQQSPKPIILAGGLTPNNVTTAIAIAHPYAVDVSGGVEISKGIKDAALINAFIAAINAGELAV
jgi:phosphoribosylanthranilate isomerase